ncbi:MAG: NUDIX domain-containing protein [Flavihumibacter sp.]|nr:NUDIX domain-containing protein [Flavihumibacter sp.]
MYIKIYFNNKPLFLCDAVTEELEPYRHHDDAVYIDELNTHTVKSMLHEMQLDKVHAGIFYHPNLAELKKAFWRKFTVIQAGGGLVENDHNEVLIIYRRGKWDLPKGKLDEGETIEQCAVREVEEECGLTNIQLGPLLLTTYHTYNESGKTILKESYWYKMKVAGSPQLVPQTEEDIQAVKWIAKTGFAAIMSNTFPSIKDVLALY